MKLLLLNALITTLLIGPIGPRCAFAGPIAEALENLLTQDNVKQSVSLEDLGLTQPLSLSSSDATRRIFLPVPPGIALIDPKLYFSGDYLRADGGQTTYLMSIDGSAVAGRSLIDERGQESFIIPLNGEPRENGFVVLGIDWSSNTNRWYCDDTRPIGNQLLVQPKTFLEYQFNAEDVKTVSTAYASLPQKVVVLISGNTLDQKSYDAAWRLGVALEQDGKTVEFEALPMLGDTIDTDDLNVPIALQEIPSFAALAKNEPVVITNPAVAGAFFLLGGVKPNLAVVDENMTSWITTALAALQTEVLAADGDALTAFNQHWGERLTLARILASGTVGLASLGGAAKVIAVSADGAHDAASLFSTIWRRAAISDQLVIKTASSPVIEGDVVPLTTLSNTGGSFDVISRGEWSTTFDLFSDNLEGKTPIGITLSVSAAPGATATKPVASVLINGTLLGAKQLLADGKPEQISIAVPPYALQLRNTIVVRVQRQPFDNECREKPQGYPVSVLPDSWISLGDALEAQNFVSIAPALSNDTSVIIHSDWLNQAVRTLPNLVKIAYPNGISADRADFEVVDTATVVAPGRPFIFFDVGITSGSEVRQLEDERILIESSNGEILFDATGLTEVAVLYAETNGVHPGLIYRSIGKGPIIEKPVFLGLGDVAIIGSDGVLSEINSSGRIQNLDLYSDRPILGKEGSLLRLMDGVLQFLREISVSFIAIIILVLILFYILASIVRRRHRRDNS